MNNRTTYTSSLRAPGQRMLATLAQPFAKLEFAISSWASRRLLEQGPAGSPLSRLRDRISGQLFERSSLRAEQRRRLEAASTIDDLIDRAGEVLFSNQKRPEITELLSAIRALAPASILEIGVATGGTNLLLSRAADSVTFVIAIDLLVRNKSKLAYFAPEDQERLFLDASSYATSTVQAVSSALGKRKLDVLFIDGDHTYEGARRDFECYSPLVREGGIIALHDIVPDEVTRSGIFTGNWVGEVPALWRDLQAAYPSAREFIADPTQDGYGIGIIYFDPKVVPKFRDRPMEPTRPAP